MCTHDAALLVGGGSRRMGEDKAWLRIGGTTLWQHQRATLAKTGAGRIYLSASVAQEFPVPEAEMVRDAEPDVGPLGGICAVLSVTRASHLLVLAVDTPLVTAGFLNDLLGQCREGIGCVPRVDDRFEPLVAVYPVGMAPMLRARLDARRAYAVQPLVRAAVQEGLLQVHGVTEAQRALLANCNDATTWRDMVSEGGGG